MELFEDGGLKEEGGMIEPESGNVVPSGSSREEVADDIPAMLSEGEFVFPADVTRYIGLDKLMSLRQDAKMGLAQMESMGQMGEERDASKDEELPFGMADLIVVSEGGEPLEMAEGGVASTRSLATSAVPTRPNRKTTYKEIMGQNRIIFKEYKNAAGESMTIAFLGNVPLYPIPDGYTYYDPSNPDSHPSTGVGGTAPPTQPNILVEEPREYSGELDNLGRPVGSVHTPPNYSTMDNVEFTSAMTTKHTEGLNTDKIALGLISIVAPPVGFVATIAHYKDVQLDIARMEARKSQGNLTAEQTKALDAAIATAKGKIGGAFAKGVLNITDSIAKALGLNPQQIEQYKNNATQAADAAVNTETNNTETVESFVDRVQKEVTSTAQQKSNEQMITDQSFTSPTPQQKSNEQMITDQSFTPTSQQIANQQMTSGQSFTPQQIANQQMTSGQSFMPASPSNNVVDITKPNNVSDSIIQKSMPTAEFNPVTGQLDSKLPFTPVADPTFNQFVSGKAAVGRPIDRIDPMLGMPMDASMIDTSNIKNINPTLGMPMNPISKPAAGVGYDIGLGDTSISSVAPVTDDYGNAFTPQAQLDMFNLGYGQQTGMPGMTGFGGGYQPASQPSTAPAAGVGYDIGITTPQFSPETKLDESVRDQVVSDFNTSKNTMVDAYSAYNPYGTTAATTTGIKSDDYGNVQDPSEIPTEKTTFDSIVGKDNQAEYDRLADASALSNREKALGDIDPREVNLSNQQMPTNQMMGLTPTPSAGKYSYAKDLDKDFNVVSTPVETPVVKKYKPEGIVPGAYTGSGMNNTISPGSKIAGVTGVEGVVPDSKNPGKVSKVSKTLSNGNTTEHTVFSNTLGDLYAKNPFGTTFSVTQNSDGTFTAGDKTPKSMPTDAQPTGFLSGVLSGGTKSTPTVSTSSKSFAPADKSKSDKRSGGLGGGTKSTPTVSKSFAPADKSKSDKRSGGSSSSGSSGASSSSSSSGTGAAAPSGRDAAEASFEGGGDGPDGKIVCTEMYKQTRLEDWKNDMKIWGLHTTTHLTPYHQNGYHVLFKPWVRGMRKYKWLMLSGGWLAKRRTQHLKHVLSNSGYFEFGINKNEKDDIVGNIWCKVWHPVSYIVGKLKSIITGKN